MTAQGNIYGINGPIIYLKGDSGFQMNEMVYVGTGRLVGEVIGLTSERTTIEVYEETTGLKPGEPVAGTGAPVSATLAPGILTSIFDGIERPLNAIQKESGCYIDRGIHADSLDTKKKWHAHMTVKKGDRLYPGAVIAEVPETRAITQDIRPLQILLLNLMPTKIETETQLARVLGNTPIQIELELIAPSGHVSKNTSQAHMLAFYKSFDEVRDRTFDGLVITGAPVELMEFEEVDYWPELCEIMEWSKTHVHSTLHICWGAQAGLYYHYGIPKRQLPEKLFGVFRHTVEDPNFILFRGFDDEFWVPHSRHTTVLREDIEAIPELKILASSPEAGVYAVKTDQGRQIFLMGHAEYDRDTLRNEYIRDLTAGADIRVPKNYFPGDDPSRKPAVTWRSCAHLLYSNWLNYFVYQTSPYNIRDIERGIRTDD